MLFNASERMEKVSKRNFVSCEIPNITEISNALVMPMERVPRPPVGKWQPALYKLGVYESENLKFVESSKHLRNYDLAFLDKLIAVGDKYSKEELENVESNECFKVGVYGGIIFDHFGHFLIETLARLWYVVENNYKGRIIFYEEGKAMSRPYINDIFNLLGIKEQIYIIRKPIMVERLYIPEQSMFYQHSAKNCFLLPYMHLFNVTEKMLSSKVEQHKKIYLSRNKIKGRGEIFGEDKLELFFKENGYAVIYPEKLSMEEQIYLVGSAENVAGINGSALHLLLFNLNSPTVTNIIRNDWVNANFFMFDQLLGNHVNYIFAGKNRIDTSATNGPFEIDLTVINDSFWKIGLRNGNELLKLDTKSSIQERIDFLCNWRSQQTSTLHLKLTEEERMFRYMELILLNPKNLDNWVSLIKFCMHYRRYIEATAFSCKLIRIDTEEKYLPEYKKWAKELQDAGQLDEYRDIIGLLKKSNT